MDRERPELRPLGVGEMVDAAIRLFRTNFGTLVRISAAVLVPIGIVQLVATLAVGPIDLNALETIDETATTDQALDQVFDVLLPAYTALGLTSILSFLGSVLVQAASITALAQYFTGDQPDWRESLRVGLRRWFPLVVSTIVLSVVSSVGLIFCLIPGIFIFTMWAVSPVALVTEQKGPLAALGRSYRLAKGRFWPVLGAIVLAYLLYFVANQILGSIVGFLTVFGASETGVISFTPSVVSSVLVSVVATPFLAAMVTILYFDLRVRKEGYDLELMAEDLERLERRDTPRPPADGDDPFGLGSPGER